MFKYACERGTYIIANQILNKKQVVQKKHNPLELLMYNPEVSNNTKLSDKINPKPFAKRK